MLDAFWQKHENRIRSARAQLIALLLLRCTVNSGHFRFKQLAQFS